MGCQKITWLIPPELGVRRPPELEVRRQNSQIKLRIAILIILIIKRRL